jgi:hypothetical protein
LNDTEAVARFPSKVTLSTATSIDLRSKPVFLLRCSMTPSLTASLLSGARLHAREAAIRARGTNSRGVTPAL